MSFPRYEKYKDSGVEWLGEVPEGWEVISIKWLSPVQRGASPRPIEDPKYFDESGEYAWVRIADVSASDGVLRESEQQLSELGSSLSVKLQPGELFISIAGTVGKPCLSEIKACIHDGFVYFPRLTIEPKFLYRIFEAGVCYQGLGKFGTQLNLNTDTIGSIRIALPPQNEISAVLSFLDRETGKIDALVAEQERLVELLKEKRQAVISHAVTKGLDPDAPMKDSGVEWLGEVPDGWEVAALKRFCKLITDGAHVSPETENGVYSFVSTKDIGDNIIDFESCLKTSESSFEYLVKTGCRPYIGDVLFSKDGTIGRTVVVRQDVDFVVASSLIIIRPDDMILNSEYLNYLCISNVVASQVEGFVKGAGLPRLSIQNLLKVIGVFPSTEEQSAIVTFLDTETTKIDTLIAGAQQAIILLKERRSALISAAVTGKIDVRDTV